MKLKNIIWFLAMVLAIISITGCGGAAAAKDGDKVSVHYTGTLEDGTVFDSSREREPLEFVLGAGQMIPGFDKAVRGMKVGEVKKVTLKPEDAYGEYRQDLVATLSRDEIPANLQLEVGQQVPLQTESGGFVIGTVVRITEESIVVDTNHRLAGKTLTFEIELVAIEPAD